MSPGDASWCLAHWSLPLLLGRARRHIQVIRKIESLTWRVWEQGIVQIRCRHGLWCEAEVLWWWCRRRLHLTSGRQGSWSGRRLHVEQELGTLVPCLEVSTILVRIVCIVVVVVAGQPAIPHGWSTGRRGPCDCIDSEGVGRKEIVLILIGSGKVWCVETSIEAVGGGEEGYIRPGGGLEVGLPAWLDGGGLGQLAMTAIGPRDMTWEGFVGSRRHSISFCRTRHVEVIVKGG